MTRLPATPPDWPSDEEIVDGQASGPPLTPGHPESGSVTGNPTAPDVAEDICDLCAGAGQVDAARCRACGGSGRRPR